MVSHCSLSDRKSPQVSRMLLSILADLNIVVVWRVLICPLISKSSGLFDNSLGIVAITRLTICIIVTHSFHRYFSFQIRSRYQSLFLILILFYGLRGRKSPLYGMLSVLFNLIYLFIYFLLTMTKSDHLA